MASEFPKDLQKIIDFFSLLPGVGPRSAFRMAMHLIRMQEPIINDFSDTINDISSKIMYCKICHNICEDEYCRICLNDQRNKSQIMVIEDVLDLVAFERMNDYKGVYHVMGGVLSPMRGVGVSELNMLDLFDRVEELTRNGDDVEIIIATNPNLEGEATAMYIKSELAKIKCKITRIARGIPSGAEIDYADNSTLSQALNRRDLY